MTEGGPALHESIAVHCPSPDSGGWMTGDTGAGRYAGTVVVVVPCRAALVVVVAVELERDPTLNQAIKMMPRPTSPRIGRSRWRRFLRIDSWRAAILVSWREGGPPGRAIDMRRSYGGMGQSRRSLSGTVRCALVPSARAIANGTRHDAGNRTDSDRLLVNTSDPIKPATTRAHPERQHEDGVRC